MSYSKETVRKAKDVLSERRDDAFAAADARRALAFSQNPRLEKIETSLASLSVKAAKAVFSSENAAEILMQLKKESETLVNEQKEILASFGYPENFLEPQFSCPICEDTGYVEKENRTVLCDCFKKLLSDTACGELSAVSPLSLSTFDSFDLNYYSKEADQNGKIPFDRMSKIYDYLVDYARTFSKDAKSLLLRGATGLGKTHLSLAVANEVLKDGFSVIYVSAPDIFSKLEREHFSRSLTDEEETMKTLTGADLLIVDDLGTEFSTQYTIAAVYSLFNTRILKNRPTIINTNLSISELEQAYSQRFVSRVIGSCIKLDFIGSDVRAKI